MGFVLVHCPSLVSLSQTDGLVQPALVYLSELPTLVLSLVMGTSGWRMPNQCIFLERRVQHKGTRNCQASMQTSLKQNSC